LVCPLFPVPFSVHRDKLADTLALPLDRISVKFKTSEKVGPVGEGKSAEAQAVVTLRRE